MKMKKWHQKMAVTLVVALSVGWALGASLFTFYYGRGLSYLSNDPKACINCHVMQDQYLTWSKSSHHHVAVCNDCHAPHDFIGKYMTKATNGYHHSVAFTSGNFAWPIHIKENNREITRRACLHCHDQLLGEQHSQQSQCLKCHRGVAHAL